MNLWQSALMGLVQGLTEFIPVSSSGHLVLLHHFLNLDEGGLAFDVALHIGTLLALIIFFVADLKELALGLAGKNDRKKLVWLLALATLPAVLAGVLLENEAETAFRSARLVIIGLAQAAAIVPGVSRSGSTITAGLFTGFDRVAATRFSFLLGIPVTFGAVAKVLLTDSAALSAIRADWGVFLVGISAAFASGVFAIRFLLNYLSKHSLAVFGGYRLILAFLVWILV